ncbi:hypothetical protein QM480_06200 [Flectobacillus sp. DC10W]|uniref:Dual OB-containing domain-containing protein n=1 Tax=Flectobacillus longus TaxID=2984207 RepID=A0ABT6YL59_9BACT|nr:CFI-box-CTERM domain-containing protein [Flectobacillus longus]MDI9863906.1 hypothetical protein [Flectobacillus longus]
MEVLILSKTKYGSTQVCVGGICIINQQFIRLLNKGGYYQPADTQFNIGDIWDITFTINPNRKEPHNEDVTIQTYKFVRKIYALETYIKNMDVPIWRNNISNIFEGKILWQRNGKGYFSENIKNYPSHSVGFWISDVDLRYSNGSYFYESNGVSKQIVYKGNQTALQVIPKGKLIRLSLAKWWKPEDSEIEARCYLQLSGWYEDQPEPVKKIEVKPTVKAQSISKNYEIPKYQVPKITPQPKNTSGPCYIATLCYNDFYAEEVCSFRDFRDATLTNTRLGRLFIAKYYIFAPKLTAKLENHKIFNRVIKHIILNPLLIIIKTLKLDRK